MKINKDFEERIQRIISESNDNGTAAREVTFLFKEQELSNFQSDVRENYAKKTYVWTVTVSVVFPVTVILLAIGSFALNAIKSAGG